MSYIRGESREQLYLLPEAIDDYVGPENPVRFLDVFVEKLAGEALTYRFSTVEQGRSIRTYSTAACSTCALKPQCTRNKESRRITRWEDEAVLERMEQRVSEHPEIMRKRKMLAEHPFGTIKRWMDQSYFLMRGQDKVSAETSLTVLAYNITRVINILGVTPLVRALASAVDGGSR